MSIIIMIIQILVAVTIIYFVLRTLDEIRKASVYRNEILNQIRNELTKLNEK